MLWGWPARIHIASVIGIGSGRDTIQVGPRRGDGRQAGQTGGFETLPGKGERTREGEAGCRAVFSVQVPVLFCSNVLLFLPWELCYKVKAAPVLL